MKRFFSLIMISLFCFSHVFPTIKGSESALSVESFYTFPAAGSDNTMLGFGWFKNGFALEDATTSCTFNSVFPVSGNVSLNGGGLYLNADLYMHNVVNWDTPGTIYGGGYFFELCSSVTQMGTVSYDQIFDQTKISVNSDLVISGSITFKDECFVNGNGKRILLGDDGWLLVDSGATVTLKNIAIDGIVAGKICCLDDSSKIVFDDVTWIQDGDYSFTQGSFKILSNVDFVGSHTFFYQSKMTSTISLHSTWRAADDLWISLGKNNGNQPLYFVDNTAIFHLDNCRLVSNAAGFSLTRGTLLCDHKVDLELNSTDSTDGLVLGDGTEDGDLSVVVEAGAAVHFRQGDLVYNMSDPNCLVARGVGSQLVRYGETTFYINQDLTIPGLRIVDRNLTAAMVAADGVTTLYDGTVLEWSGVGVEVSGCRYNWYTTLLAGNQEVFLVKGIFPSYISVSGNGNLIHGDGSLSGQVILADSDAEIQMRLNGLLLESVILNGGTLALYRDLYFTQDSRVLGSGKVELSDNKIVFGAADQAWTGDVLWEGDVGHIDLFSKIDLSGTWTINGECIIDGNDNTLDLSSGGEIVVAENGVLCLRNIMLKGVSGNNIRCLDNTGTVTLEEMIWFQDGHYSLTQGRLYVAQHVDMRGEYTFSYESRMTSTVAANAEWHPLDDLTLYLGKNNGYQPLYFEDETAVLHLDNCTLKTNADGFSLTRGTLLCHHMVDLEINSTDSTDGLILGDGTSNGNIKLVVEAGAAVHFRQGDLVYNMTDPNALISRGSGSQLVRYGGTTFYINQDIVIADLRIVDRNLTAAMVAADGVTTLYDNTVLEWSGVGVEVSGYRYNWYTTLLAGNQELFLIKGIFPSYVSVLGNGNVLQGDGSLSGQIILADSNAELQIKLNGLLLESVYLQGGTISLYKDLSFANDYRILDSGKVELLGSKLNLGSADQAWSGDVFWEGEGGHIDMNSKIELSGTWTFKGANFLHGQGNTLKLLDGASIVIDADSSLSLRELKVEGITGNNIRCLSDSSSIVLDDATWLCDGDYSFTVGSMAYLGDNLLSSTYTFSYESSQTSTVYAKSKLALSKDMRFVIGRKEGLDSQEPLYFEDESSQFKLKGCTFAVTSSGACLTRGTLIFNEDIFIDIDSTSSTYGLHLGDGTAANDIKLNFGPGSSVKLVDGDIVVNVVNPDLLVLNQGNARLIRGAASNMYFKQDVNVTNLIIATELGATLNNLDGAEVTYLNCLNETVFADFSLTGKKPSAVLSSLDGAGELYIHKGTLPLGTLVSGASNRIRGNGSISGSIILQDSSSQVGIDLNGALLTDVTLNGGTVELDDDLRMALDKKFTGAGMVNLDTYELTLGAMDKTWTGSVYWDGTEGHISLNSQISLAGTWTFSGTCVIHGNWNILELGAAAEIVVEKGSTLIMRELKIKDLSGTKIRCLDGASYIFYDNCKARMDENYSFTQGHFDVNELLEIHGSCTFVYQSPQQSFIYPCASLRMTEGSALSYDPVTADRDRLTFYNCKSILELHDASLHSTTTGWQIMKGRVEVYGDSFVYSDATVLEEGIRFGDGESADNDCCVDVKPDADLRFVSGYVVDKNVL